MLYFRAHRWLLVPGTSRFTAWIDPRDRTAEDTRWNLNLHYFATGAQWRRVEQWKRPRLLLEIVNFRPRLRHWTDLERVSFWEKPMIDDADGSRGWFHAEYAGGPGEAEFSRLEDHVWRVAGRDRRWLTVELAAFADGSDFVPDSIEVATTPDGREERAEADAEFWKANAPLYLLEQVPFGMVTVQVPRNVRDPEAYALGRARTLLGLERPEHLELVDHTKSAQRWEFIEGDLYAHLHFHGYYED